MISAPQHTGIFLYGWNRKYYHCDSHLEAKRLKDSLRMRGIWAHLYAHGDNVTLADYTSVAVKNH